MAGRRHRILLFSILGVFLSSLAGSSTAHANRQLAFANKITIGVAVDIRGRSNALFRHRIESDRAASKTVAHPGTLEEYLTQEVSQTLRLLLPMFRFVSGQDAAAAEYRLELRFYPENARKQWPRTGEMVEIKMLRAGRPQASPVRVLVGKRYTTAGVDQIRQTLMRAYDDRTLEALISAIELTDTPSRTDASQNILVTDLRYSALGLNPYSVEASFEFEWNDYMFVACSLQSERDRVVGRSRNNNTDVRTRRKCRRRSELDFAEGNATASIYLRHYYRVH